MTRVKLAALINVNPQTLGALTTLDEYEIAQRNSARSIGLTLTQNLMLILIGYLIIGAVVTRGADADMAYAGGLMALTVLLIGGRAPAMILAWTRRDLDDV